MGYQLHHNHDYIDMLEVIAMDDYISRQAAISVLEERIYANRTVIPVVSELNRSIGYVSRLPSADVRENVSGRWITDYLVSTGGGTYPVFRCSECENQEPMLTAKNFCPSCGASMLRGESE